jgi:hypothetical protein
VTGQLAAAKPWWNFWSDSGPAGYNRLNEQRPWWRFW